MKYFSMFSGIGGFELGIQQAYEDKRTKKQNPISQRRQKKFGDSGNGHNEANRNLRHSGQPPQECIGFSEIDKYATQIYEKHFPTHKNYGDCTKIQAAELPDFDLLVGGFPCQAFSIAGKRKGFDDTRGTLFFDIARIAKAKRPKYLLLENVKGLLSHDNGRTYKTILSTLIELGYDIRALVLNSKNFGVPQNRERVFIAGCLGGWGGREVFSFGEYDKEIISKDLEYVGAIMSEKNKKWLEDGKELSREFPQGQRVYSSKGISSALASQAGGLGAKTGLYAVLTPNRQKKRQNGRRMKEEGEPMFTLTGQDIHGVMQGTRIRRLTPTECERLQGFPDRFTEGISDTQRYKCLGNAVTVNVVREVIKTMFFNNI